MRIALDGNAEEVARLADVYLPQEILTVAVNAVGRAEEVVLDRQSVHIFA